MPKRGSPTAIMSIKYDCTLLWSNGETMGPWGPEALKFFRELSARLLDISGDAGCYLYAVQRGNAASILGALSCHSLHLSSFVILFSFSLLLYIFILLLVVRSICLNKDILM